MAQTPSVTTTYFSLDSFFPFLGFLSDGAQEKGSGCDSFVPLNWWYVCLTPSLFFLSETSFRFCPLQLIKFC